MNINTSEIIGNITPIYNQYVLNKTKISGTEALILMWKIGDILKTVILKNNIAPHTLFRILYGKSEGKTNIAQKSYISREFLGRCYRIHKMFQNLDEIKVTFPSLNNFTTFREAMPFLDDGKFKLKGQEREELILLLNSKKSYSQIMSELNQIKTRKIGIKNPRTQRLKEVEPEKELFLRYYNDVLHFLKVGNYELLQSKFMCTDGVLFRKLSTLLGSFVSADSIIPEITVSENEPTIFKDLKKLALSLKKDIKKRRRFSRLVTTSKISRFSDYLFALHSKDTFLKLHNRLK